MNILDQFPVHERFLWRFEDAQNGLHKDYIKSYYHNLTAYIPCHMHDFFEINIITHGAGKHLIEQRDILTQKGDVFIIPPHIRHGYSCHDNMTVYHILLSNRFMAIFAPYLEQLSGYKMLFNIEPVLRSRIDKGYYLRSDDISFELIRQYISLLEDGHKSDPASYEPEQAFHVLSLIAVMSRQIHELKPFHTQQLPEQHVLTLIESLEYIEHHFSEKLNFQTISTHCAMSYATYLRLFKKLSGVTPTEYQMNCRITHAANLLRSSEETILSIALTCGFYDSSHFIREFIRKKGVSPAEYRKNDKNTSRP